VGILPKKKRLVIEELLAHHLNCMLKVRLFCSNAEPGIAVEVDELTKAKFFS
jgi:hypothetical protein